LAMMGYNGSATLLGAVGLGIPVFVSERIDPLSTTGRSSSEKRFMSFLFTHLSQRCHFSDRAGQRLLSDQTSVEEYGHRNPLDVDALGDRDRCALTDVPLVVSVGRLARSEKSGIAHHGRLGKSSISFRMARLIIYGEGQLRVKCLTSGNFALRICLSMFFAFQCVGYF
jgi:hypothetical protein